MSAGLATVGWLPEQIAEDGIDQSAPIMSLLAPDDEYRLIDRSRIGDGIEIQQLVRGKTQGGGHGKGQSGQGLSGEVIQTPIQGDGMPQDPVD